MLLPILVLDANIIISAVLGKRVRDFLIQYSGKVEFFTPDTCIAEAEEYLPKIFESKKLPVSEALGVFSKIKPLLQILDPSIYQERAFEAHERMDNKDLDDWPVVAIALLLNCSIWTQDKDFFGVGLPTWTTDRVHIFFKAIDEQRAKIVTDSTDDD